MNKKIGVVFLSILILVSQSSFAVEVFKVDLTQSLEMQVENSCPWIATNEVQQMSIAGPEEVGWSGGDGSKLLNDFFDATGAEVNHTSLDAALPVGTKAVYFNTQYFNTDGNAQIIITELSFSYAAGDTVTLSLSDEESVLKQIEGDTGESLLVCFSEGEEYARMSTKVTHQNVDGSRPTFGITALTDWQLEPL